MRYFLSLGSNLGDRGKNLERALSHLKTKGVKLMKCSSLYETQPVDFSSQPWFFNQVVEIDINLNPGSLLRLVKKIENRMGRKTSVPSGPRIIDIDILLADDYVVKTKELEIPHPRLEKRNFVLIPLREISPGTRHPVLKKTIKDLADKSPDQAVVRKIEQIRTS